MKLREAPHHKNLTCYTHYRCRLPECVQRYNRDHLERKRSKAAGTWDRLVDAAPVRAHVQTLLNAGATLHGVATHAGVDDQTVRRLFPAQHGTRRTSPKYRMSSESTRKILAVTAADVTPPLINATGTVRRIQALAAEGWPLSHLAGQFGIYPKYIYELLRRTSSGKTTEVLPSTARQVARAYDELRATRPERNGVDKRKARAARKRAATNNWPTASYWSERMDAIDDPHFTPEYKKLRAQIIAEEAHWLMTMGDLDRDQAADRIGVARFTIDRALREHPQHEQQGRAAA